MLLLSKPQFPHLYPKAWALPLLGPANVMVIPSRFVEAEVLGSSRGNIHLPSLDTGRVIPSGALAL